MKNLDYAQLLSVYENMLTPRQRDFMELYYWEDLSLGEIAQSEGVTRQAVRDSIKRSEQLLAEYEQKLGFAEKTRLCRKSFGEIMKLAQSLTEDSAARIIETAEKGSDIF